jgi:hypothetical protein
MMTKYILLAVLLLAAPQAAQRTRYLVIGAMETRDTGALARSHEISFDRPWPDGWSGPAIE